MSGATGALRGLSGFRDGASNPLRPGVPAPCSWCGKVCEVYALHYGEPMCAGCHDWKQELRSDSDPDDDRDYDDKEE